MNPTLRRIDDPVADWPRLQPLFQQFQEHHAALAGQPLRQNSAKNALKRLSQTFASTPCLLLAAEAEGRFVGMGMGRIAASHARPGTEAGYLGSFFIEPAWRGSHLVQRLHREIESWLRGNGMGQAERFVFTANQRTLRLWHHLGYEPFSELLRKPVASGPTAGEAPPGCAIETVEDVDAAWPRLWPLVHRQEASLGGRLGRTTPDQEEAQRDRLRKLAQAHRHRILLASNDGRPAGLASTRLIKNPWLFEERSATLADFFLDPEQDLPGLAEFLLDQVEIWLAAKGADSLQYSLPMQQTQAWRERGFEPYFTALRKDL